MSPASMTRQGVREVDLAHPSELDAWGEEWDRLARAAGGLVCQSAAWLKAWWSVYEPDAGLVLLVDDSGDEVEGMWAIARLRRRLHRRVPVSIPYVGIAGGGLGAGDHMGPVTASPASAERLVQAAVRIADGHSLHLPNVGPSHQGVVGRVPGVQVVTTVPCPFVDLRGVERAEELWGASRRGDVRRCMRRLGEAGFERRWVRLDGPSAHLDRLRELHVALWSSRGRTGLFDDRRHRFLTELAGGLEEPDGAWLQLIGSSEGDIAAMLAFRFGSTMCSYTTGWDPAYHRFGLGVLLEAGGIELAVSQGLDRYDFLRGTEPHKLSLGGIVEEDVTYCVPRGPLGRLLLHRDRLAERRSEH